MGGETTSDTSWVMTQLQHINDKIDLEDQYQRIKDFVNNHPIYALFIAATIATCCIPVICFLFVLVGSFVFGLTGFIFFEGVVLVLSTIALGGVLCFTITLAVFICGFTLATYYGMTIISDLLQEWLPSAFRMNKTETLHSETNDNETKKH